MYKLKLTEKDSEEFMLANHLDEKITVDVLDCVLLHLGSISSTVYLELRSQKHKKILKMYGFIEFFMLLRSSGVKALLQHTYTQLLPTLLSQKCKKKLH